MCLATGMLAALLLLPACGTVTSPGATGSSPSPLPACPAPVDGQVPTDCVPYDPEHAMEQNERYRDRAALDGSARAGNAGTLEQATEALEALGASDEPLTEGAVERALTDVGLEHVRARGDGAGGVRFGVGAPAGGCLVGGVAADGSVSAQLAGVILDGGCLPAS
ncbi:hypothetical protein SAMN05216184_10598 [Georgenia satyanarayanai]|uniref:Uncharacterized protein n=1 Tax=Georgenia satyanarayanai TaxID=860221 RepID=A0A2Y9AH22_9MICO|nr:hypothetical protein A8987_10598 [Georgenia satyanarayanai]SSA41839.1 hypothetical protein SAMN05216184_10598 [Georgenia satyanarayanai]